MEAMLELREGAYQGYRTVNSAGTTEAMRYGLLMLSSRATACCGGITTRIFCRSASKTALASSYSPLAQGLLTG